MASVRGVTDDGASASPQRVPGVAWVAVDDEIVALDPAGRAHVITSTGALLWPLLDGMTSADELGADVADVFSIDPDVALTDVRRFVNEMVALGLVVVAHDHEATS